MALPKVGVQAVVQDMQKFTRDLNSVNTSVNKTIKGLMDMEFAVPAGSNLANVFDALRQSLYAVAPEIGIVLAILGKLKEAFDKLTAPIKKAWETIKNFVSDLSGKIWSGIKTVAKNIFDAFNVLPELWDLIQRTASIAFGVLVRDAIRNIGEAIKDLAGNVLEAASNFQLLEIRLRGLALRDIIENYNENGLVRTPEMMATAFAQASKEAKELLLWVSRIAIQSPFSTQDVANAFTMAKGFGLTTEMAKSSTEAVLNFTAGMGLSGEQMERVLLNFGQMWQQGKVTGRELRDLAVGALVPTTRIFELMGKKVGKTAAQMRKLATDGKMSVSDFINAFSEMAMTDFPDAAKNMTRTLEGLKEKVKDFGETYFGFFLVKPSLDVVTRTLSDFFDLFMGNERFLASIETLGAAFGGLMEKIFKPEIDESVVDKVSAFLEGLSRLVAAISTGDLMLVEETLKQLGIPQWIIDSANNFYNAWKDISGFFEENKAFLIGTVEDILAAMGIKVDLSGGVEGFSETLVGIGDYLQANGEAIRQKISDIVTGIERFFTVLRTGELPQQEFEFGDSNIANMLEEAEGATAFDIAGKFAGIDQVALDIHNMAVDIQTFIANAKMVGDYFNPALEEVTKNISTHIKTIVMFLTGEEIKEGNEGVTGMTLGLQVLYGALQYVDGGLRVVIFTMGIAKTIIDGFRQAISDTGSGMRATGIVLKNAWDEIKAKIEATVTSIISFVLGLFGLNSDPMSKIRNFGKNVVAELTGMKNDAIAAVKTMVDDIGRKFASTFAIPDGTAWSAIANFVFKVIGIFENMWNEMTQNSIIPDMMSDIEDEMVGGFRDTFAQSAKLAKGFVGNMQVSANYARNVPFSSGNNYSNTYNMNFNANYAQTQSPVTVKYDVQALLMAVSR